MRKIYYLHTCSTCQRILKEIKAEQHGFELQDIKSNKITLEQLDEMRALTDSYDSLFSKRAMKYKSLGLKDKSLSENDIKNYILEEYTFLKRPVSIIDGEIFIGNSKKTVEQIIAKLHA